MIKTIGKAASQLVLGWDTNIAILTFAFTSIFFDEPTNPWVFVVAGICAYLPDLDFIPFLVLRRRLGVDVGHWVFGHYPPIVLPLEVVVVAIVGSLVWPGHVGFLVAVALICTIGHFVHDGASKPHGFHFFAPLTRDGRIQFPVPWSNAHPRDLYVHYRIGWDQCIEEAPPEEVQKMYSDCAFMTSGGGEIVGRIEPVTKSQITAFCIGFSALLALIAHNGWA